MRCEHISGCYDDATQRVRFAWPNGTPFVEVLCDACAESERRHLHPNTLCAVTVEPIAVTDAMPGDVVIVTLHTPTGKEERIGRVRVVEYGTTNRCRVDLDDGRCMTILRKNLIVIERCDLPTKRVGDLSRVLDVETNPIAFAEAA